MRDLLRVPTPCPGFVFSTSQTELSGSTLSRVVEKIMSCEEILREFGPNKTTRTWVF